jgi:NAD(P)-dependent dehydrogenase (short-subunit alcohol dehydrogenase family)
MTFSELTSLRGQTAVVTGGAGGLANCFCETLCELGADLMLLDRNEDALKDTAARLHGRFGTEVVPVAVDLENEDARREAVQFVLQHRPKLDILINAAAFVGSSSLEGWVGPLEEQSVATWRRALEVNLTAAFALSQSLAPALRASGRGRIINFASIYGVSAPDFGLYENLPGMGNPAAYAASKAGLVQLTRWLATALAPEVRVNCLSPGGVFSGQPEEFVRRYAAKTPLGRMADATDIAGAVAFLATDLSRYVTGQNLMVDGGWTVW